MSETAVNLGNWIASNVAGLVADRETLAVLVLNAKSLKEVLDLITPLSKRLKNGVTVWAKGPSEKPGELAKIKFRKQEEGTWDIVILSPNSIETAGNKSIGSDILHGLTLVKPDDRSRLIVCVPSSAETSPVAVRVRVFGHSAPPTEELKGALSEEDVYQVLESIGFASCHTYRLDCRVDVGKFFKGSPNGVKELSDWLRVSLDVCKRASSQEQGQLRRLCERGSDEILQPKTVFSIPVPHGFERDNRAQPSPRDWWPNGDLKTFRNHGLEKWNETRSKWEKEGAAGIGMHDVPKKPITKVPKLSARDLNGLVETLTTNHDRIELPHPMRLDDLLDVLVDVWDSLDDGA